MRSRSKVSLILAGLVLIGASSLVKCAGDANQKPHKNRVPTMQEQAEATQQSAQAAKEAADRAEQAKKDIQSQIEKLNGAQRNSSGELKEGRAEMTAPGTISDFGSAKVEVGGQNESVSDDYYLGFTFIDRNGFTKRFFPVCPNQTVKIGTPFTLMYHWRGWVSTATGQRGCYQIDGFQQ
jgi:hypothetical protein